MKRILLWGTGKGFHCIMETAIWKKDIELLGVAESGKVRQDHVVHKDVDIPVMEIDQAVKMGFDSIIITNSYYGECVLKALALGIHMEQIVIPCMIDPYQKETETVSMLGGFVDNPYEVVEKLSCLYGKKEKKKCLIMGMGADWDFFVSFARWKKDIDVIGSFNFENNEIMISSKKVKMLTYFEICEIEYDYVLVMDSKYYNDLIGINKISIEKIIIPYTTGFENSKYDVVMRLSHILENAEEVVDYLSVRHIAGKGIGNMRPMKYDLIKDTLMNDRHTWKKYDMRIMSGDYARIRNLELLIEELKNKNVKGAMAEVGVFKGHFAKIMSYYLPDREFYLYDTFEGYDSEDLKLETQEEDFNDKWASKAFKTATLDSVKEYIGNQNQCHYRPGYFPQTVKDKEKGEKFCLVSLDANLYNPTLAGLEFFYPRLSEGGYILLHEYNFCWIEGGQKILLPGIKKAVQDFEKKVGHICYVPITDLNGTLVITK